MLTCMIHYCSFGLTRGCVLKRIDSDTNWQVKPTHNSLDNGGIRAANYDVAIHS